MFSRRATGRDQATTRAGRAMILFRTGCSRALLAFLQMKFGRMRKSPAATFSKCPSARAAQDAAVLIFGGAERGGFGTIWELWRWARAGAGGLSDPESSEDKARPGPAACFVPGLHGAGADFQSPQHEIHPPLPALKLHPAGQRTNGIEKRPARVHGFSHAGTGAPSTVTMV